MAKLLRSRKQFGRCRVRGHSYCEVTDDIQTIPFTRHQDKEEWRQEVEEQLREAEVGDTTTTIPRDNEECNEEI